MNDYIVGIVNEVNFQPVLNTVGTSPMRVTVRESSTLTSWPVEDGTQRTDHRVINPVEIDLPLILHTEENRNLFERLREIFLRGEIITVQTQVRSYDSMMVVDIPHEESPDVVGGTPVAVKFKQVITIKPEFGTLPASRVANKKQASTVNKGGQQTQPADAATQRKSSTLYRLSN